MHDGIIELYYRNFYTFHEPQVPRGASHGLAQVDQQSLSSGTPELGGGLQGGSGTCPFTQENITRLASAEQKYETKVGSIQQELQICISNLNN